MLNALSTALVMGIAWLCVSSCAAAPVNNTPGVVSLVTEQSNAGQPKAMSTPLRGKSRLPRVSGVSAVNTDREPEKVHPDSKDAPPDATTFSDLPTLDIDEAALRGRQIIGHDQLIESELKRLLLEFGEDTREVPEVFLNEVKLYIRAYQQNPYYRKFITSSLKRSTRYMSAVKKIFTRRNIPEDMAYIAFVESGFNPNARSRAGALGMWQFMPGTARDYSLRVTKEIDERLDPTRSTYAACEYFHDLIAIFGPRSFLLALAAYNAGEGKVISCLKRIDNPLAQRTFWHIRPCLAPESREYPPRIIAAAVIGNNPEVFGFPRYEVNGEEFELSSVPEMEATNRQMRIPQPSTAPRQARPRSVRQPGEKRTLEEPRRAEVARRAAPKPFIYMVKKGNTLDGVAEAFRVSREDIKRWNNLKGNHLLAGARLKIVSSSPLETVHYTVRRGDTVRDVGQSFGVRPVRIIVCNGLNDGVGLKPGYRLVVYREMKQKPTIYTVKKGTSLTRIAETFDVRPKDIMRWNNLNSPALVPNQKLRIYRDLKGA